jgi:uncharacterized protein
MNRNAGLLLMFLSAVFLLVSISACTRKEDSAVVPVRRGWVNDYADVLQPQEKARISAILEAYEKETCHQIYVLIVKSLDGEKVTEFSQRTALAWKIGQPGIGNGFLVTIAMQEGKIRIESGTAFEWFIKDGTANNILKNVIIPLFRQDRFIEGLEQGLDEIMAAGRRKPIPDDLKPASCRQQAL